MRGWPQSWIRCFGIADNSRSLGSGPAGGHNRGLPPETAAAPSTNSAAAQLDQNCFAIFGTRTVLAESPEFVDSACRGLMVSGSRPRLCPLIEFEFDPGVGRSKGAAGVRPLETIRPRLAQQTKVGLSASTVRVRIFRAAKNRRVAQQPLLFAELRPFREVLPQSRPPSQSKNQAALTNSIASARKCPWAISSRSWASVTTPSCRQPLTMSKKNFSCFGSGWAS